MNDVDKNERQTPRDHRRHPQAQGLYDPRLRKGRVRRRLRLQRRRTCLSRDRRARNRGPHEPAPPGSCGSRREHGRWGGHHDPDPRPLLSRVVRLTRYRPPPARRLRCRHHVLARGCRSAGESAGRPSRERFAAEGLPFLGWREVPTDETALGDSARATRPSVWQCFVAGADCKATPWSASSTSHAASANGPPARGARRGRRSLRAQLLLPAPSSTRA